MMTPTSADWIPLFPLNTVLFPDGVLPLRVFETRYMDMVRECMRLDHGFGIVLIKSGAEVGTAAVPEQVGCMAHIDTWEMKDLGVLILRVTGAARFRILETRVLPDNRLEARIEMLADDLSIPVSDEHLACASALKTVIEAIDAKGVQEQGSEFVSPFARPARLDDAGWVANRWTEILPIPLKAKQKLLELLDAGSRVGVIHQYLTQHEII